MSKNNKMTQLDEDFQSLLKAQSAELKAQVDAGNFVAAMGLINDLNKVRDQSLYREVGRLTRSLHEAIRNFNIDAQNAQQEQELSSITDASDRLGYVVAQTNKAANRTMDLVEEAMPHAAEIKQEAEALKGDWARLRRREMAPSEFRDLYGRIDQFFEKVTSDSDFVCKRLSDILLAQDFQDLTGQVIQKVTTLVKEVEENLVNLMLMASKVDRMTGTVHELEGQQADQPNIHGEGPQIHAEKRDDVVTSQVDVDDLLSSLGF